MKKFKNKFAVIILFIGVVVFSSCNKKDNPEVIARDFLILISKGDIEGAKKLCDETTVEEILSEYENSAEDLKRENEGVYSTITVISSEYNDTKDVAFVKFAKDGVIDHEKIELKKINGVWKVSIKADNN